MLQGALGLEANVAAARQARGQVLGPAGEPIEGALVSVSSHFDVTTSGPAYYEQRSNEQGRFRFAALPPGRYGITATRAGASAAYGGAFDVPPSASTSTNGLMLRMGGPSVIFQGAVRDERGEAVAGARVLAATFSENEGQV